MEQRFWNVQLSNRKHGCSRSACYFGRHSFASLKHDARDYTANLDTQTRCIQAVEKNIFDWKLFSIDSKVANNFKWRTLSAFVLKEVTYYMVSMIYLLMAKPEASNLEKLCRLANCYFATLVILIGPTLFCCCCWTATGLLRTLTEEIETRRPSKEKPINVQL